MKWIDFLKGFVIKDGVLMKYRGKKARVVIPDTVTKIGASAFDRNKKLVEVVIPEGVTEIGDSAFTCCYNLKTVQIPAGVTHIGELAFAWCGKLRTIALPDIEEIHYCAFYNCKSLEEVKIHDRQFLVASEAFSRCDKLADKDGFILVKSFLFDYIGNAAHVTIPDGIKTIGADTFNGCDFLETVVCPESVIKIMNRAFFGCRNLTSVTIPNKQAQIGEHAFLCGAKNMTIYAPEGSEAQQYVEENSIKFEATGSEK